MTKGPTFGTASKASEYAEICKQYQNRPKTKGGYVTDTGALQFFDCSLTSVNAVAFAHWILEHFTEQPTPSKEGETEC